MASNTSYNPANIKEYEKTKLNKDAVSTSTTVPAGTSVNIDIVMSDDSLIADGESHLLADGAARGDSFSIQVVHPIAGVVFQPVTNWLVDWTQAKQTPPKANFPAKIFAGLTLRIVYNSTGTSDVWVGLNIDKDKVLE